MPDLVLGDTIGLEIEFEDVLPNPPELAANLFSATYDRSCESEGCRISGTNLIFSKIQRLDFPYENVVVGGEYVSRLIDSSDDSYFEYIKAVTDYLDRYGERWEGVRASLHIHVCFVNPNLRMLKNALRLWKYLEDLFYLIGGMGYKFRGSENNSCYCRPLTKNGPIVVPTRRGYSQVINIGDLLDSRSLMEFWNKWGDLPSQLMAEKKYYPVRYLGFNLGSAYKRGSLEFRVFNKTLNPLFILAAIKLCKKFTGMALGEVISVEEENSVYLHRNKDEIARTFLSFAKASELDQLSIHEIMMLIERSELVHFPEDEYIFSHLKRVSTHWEGYDYFPRTFDNEKIISPKFVDLHLLRGER